MEMLLCRYKPFLVDDFLVVPHTSFICLQARSLKVSQQQGTGPAATGPVPQPPRASKLPPMDAQKNQQTDEILNAILPPRYISYA